jgi:nucleotide-binding universal stress UspA family protein
MGRPISRAARGAATLIQQRKPKGDAMNAKKILFPTDLSATGSAPLAEAAALARDQKATLLILHVEELSINYGGGEFYCGPSEVTTGLLQKMLEKVVPEDKTIPCQHRLVIGGPAEEIMRVARQEGVDLIVMGTHGRTGLKRLLMGSVAEAVIRGATCPVLVYKSPEQRPTASLPNTDSKRCEVPIAQ